MPSKVYAVRKGKETGLFYTWEACKDSVSGYPCAEYKSFKTKEEALLYLGDIAKNQPNQKSNQKITKKNPQNQIRQYENTSSDNKMPDCYAFVDGSYNITTKVYGYGGFLFYKGEKVILQGSGKEEQMASMRNVAGEILGCMAAVEKAIELGLTELFVFYDYLGIEMWANGGWKRNKEGTIAYYEYMQSVKGKLKIHFVKVKGHSGVEGNEEADILAKQAVGILK